MTAVLSTIIAIFSQSRPRNAPDCWLVSVGFIEGELEGFAAVDEGDELGLGIV